MHKLIQGPLKLKSMTREVISFNDKYFEEYSNDSFKNKLVYINYIFIKHHIFLNECLA